MAQPITVTGISTAITVGALGRLVLTWQGRQNILIWLTILVGIVAPDGAWLPYSIVAALERGRTSWTALLDTSYGAPAHRPPAG